jgi:PAS domain S-box-containing protein
VERNHARRREAAVVTMTPSGGPAIPVPSRQAVPHSLVDTELWFRAIYDTPLLLAGIADLEGRVLDANSLSVEGVGYTRDQIVGQLFCDGPWWGDDAAVREQVRRWCSAAAGGVLVRDESVWWDATGGERYVDIAVHPLTDDEGRTAYLFLSGLDITARVAAERGAAAAVHQVEQNLRDIAEARAANIQALEQAKSELASALQLSQDVLNNVADGIYGLDSNMSAIFVNPSAAKIVGYTQEELLGQDVHAMLHRLPDGSPCPLDLCIGIRAMATGTAVASEHEMLLRSDGTLVPVEMVAVPTMRDGVVTGVVESFRDLTERLAAQQQAEELRLLAQREAIQRDLADRLQRAVLTEPPSHPAMQIAVRYRAAAAEAQIGGDWYDAFTQPDGSVVLVIGDVLGHDSSAAVAMAQLRGLLRGIAYGSVESPGAILSRFEAAAHGLGVTSLTTAVLARVGPANEGQDLRLTWSNAGHLPPAVLREDGSVTMFRTPPDVLLGIATAHERKNYETTLALGSTLLLFTDGLVERRGEDIDQGLGKLVSVLAGLGGLDAEPLCDAVLERMLTPAAEDDIAVLAVHCC